ncbi:hypothetical protein DPMN_058506 [Dreissena polymorpha]|uniref:Uncharacterized protein n=1 Tax=Dreissena polymorpha TaxID=45954 RepID=A0A9D4C1W2_DREPO|nr:hypothetical protein DPMN_058506 [Dreissena polymorpha]
MLKIRTCTLAVVPTLPRLTTRGQTPNPLQQDSDGSVIPMHSLSGFHPFPIMSLFDKAESQLVDDSSIQHCLKTSLTTRRLSPISNACKKRRTLVPTIIGTAKLKSVSLATRTGT